MMRCDIRNPRAADLIAALLPREGPSLWSSPDIVPVHSGKAGLSHVLSYLRSIGILENKNSKILTPPGLGYWVYNAMRPHGFPALHADPEVKVAVVYHQYGFSQDLDAIKDECSRRKIVFIEDCAHALEGAYKGRPLGTEGLAGIYSLSKFYPSQIGGAVRAADSAVREHVSRLEKSGSVALGLFSFGVKWAATRGSSERGDSSVARRLNELAYAASPYSCRLRWSGRICTVPNVRDELAARRRNYALYRRLLPEHDELQALEHDALPYVVPLMHPRRDALEKIAATLREMALDTGIYSFDAARNIFNPRYVPCVWLPVHGGIVEDLVERIVGVVKKWL